MPTVSLGDIVDFVGGSYAGDREREISAVAPLANARPDQLSFLSHPKYSAQLPLTKAGAILVARSLEGHDARWIRVDHPYLSSRG